MSKNYTQTEVKTFCKSIGVEFSKSGDKFRVAIPGDEDTAVYVATLELAIDAAYSLHEKTKVLEPA